MNANPGKVLRQVRTEKGMTLTEASKLTGIPVSTLSKHENGKMSLNYEKLMKVSKGLDIDIARLLMSSNTEAASPINGRRSISRSGTAPTIRTAIYTYEYPIAELLRKSLNPMIIDVTVRSVEELGELAGHPGEEYVFVLEGSIDFHCDLYAPARLEVGDSLYFDGAMGHAFVAASEGPCRVLSVCSAREEELKSALSPVEEISI